MHNEDGEQVWERTLDTFGKVIKGSNNSCPFMYQGQYYDAEIELAYNRFRYYDPEDGRYISVDPIGFLSEEYNFYSYVPDSNLQIDAFGLAYKKHKKNGQFAKKPGRKKKKNTKHGNSKDYDGTTYLYRRYDADDNFLKHGISNNPNKRYSDVELDGGRLEIVDSGKRSAILKKERHLVETDPGPLNNEPWAGNNLGG